MASKLKLVKMSGTYVTVVECVSENGGKGDEYSPFEPSNKWGAEVKRVGEDRLIIDVGGYHLDVKRDPLEPRRFRGMEKHAADADKPFDVWLISSGAQPRPVLYSGKMLLAKIAKHTTVIVDCNMLDGKGTGIEYDPLDDSRSFWEVHVKLIGDELRIWTGDYRLYAWRARDSFGRTGSSHFIGVERGKYGEHLFHVYLLSGGFSQDSESNDIPGTTKLVEITRQESPFNGGRFQGWGTSLCWWANRVGYSPSLTNRAAELFFSENGLSLDIARYNIGGGDDPAHSHIVRSDSKVPGYAVGIDSNGVISYDWTADKNQRNVALAALRANPNLYFEGFSNSPPWFMTNSGCSSGSFNGKDNNLKDGWYDTFAGYIAQCTRHFKDNFGIVFRSYSPMNEPELDAWKAMSDKQEGCHYEPGETQSKMIVATRKALDNQGLSDVLVAAGDESSIDQQLKNIDLWSPTALAAVGRIDTHTYWGDKRSELRAKATQVRKTLWMSEVDGDGIAGINSGEMGAGLWLAGRIIDDMNGLQPAAWVIWDIIDRHKDKNIPNEKYQTLPQDGGLWGIGMANHDTGKIELTQKYYVFGQFTKYILPGDTIVMSTDEQSLAAYNKDTDAVKIVSINTSDSTINKIFDLSAFRLADRSARVIRTMGSFAGGEHWADKGTVPVVNKQFSYEFPGNSVVTFVIDGTSHVPVHTV